MKKWIMNLAAVFAAMNFSKEKVNEGLTVEEWESVRAAYAEQFGTTLEADKEANEDFVPAAPATSAMELSAEERAAITAALSAPAEETRPVATAKARTSLYGGAHMHTDKYLFGIEHPVYSRDKAYNRLTASTPLATLTASGRDVKNVHEDFLALSEVLQARLHEHMEAGTFEQLTTAALKEGKIDMLPPTTAFGEYQVLRTDAMLAYFKELPNVHGIFPVRSHVQNKENAVGAIIGELSQGYRKGRIFKGGMQFTPDQYKVDDLMFKFNFEDLIELEKQYIGWLNRSDASAIIKWTFIEYVMVYYGTQLVKEQNERNVIGTRVPQQNVVSNPSNLAADGAIRAVLRAIHEHRALPFETIGTYDAETMLDTVEAFADKVIEVSGSLDDKKIYLNKRHQRWYIRAYRQKYGQDSDFTGAHAELVDLHPASIIWVPNMRENDYFMFASEPGNIELLEDKPGEMLAFEYTPEFEGVAVKSRWKEGAHIVKAGAPFASRAELVADNYRHQFVFMNAPMTDLELDETINVAANTLFSVSGDTAVTTVKGAAEDRVITLYAAEAGVTIAKSGAFSKISAAFVAGAEGDYIEVYPELEDTTETIDGQTVTVSRPTGKLLELDRHVTAA